MPCYGEVGYLPLFHQLQHRFEIRRALRLFRPCEQDNIHKPLFSLTAHHGFLLGFAPVFHAVARRYDGTQPRFIGIGEFPALQQWLQHFGVAAQPCGKAANRVWFRLMGNKLCLPAFCGFWQIDMRQNTTRFHCRYRCLRCGGREQFAHFALDTLTRERVQHRHLARAGGECLFIWRALAVMGVKTEEAQDTQAILADTLRRIADKAHMPCCGIRLSTEIVIERYVRRGVKRVHGEVAPRSILLPVVSIGHFRMAAIAIDIAAQGGDFIALAVANRRDRAMGNAGGNSADIRLLQSLHHLFGRQGAGGINVIDHALQQRITHATADKA